MDPSKKTAHLERELRRRRSTAAFTLVEVVLAVSIAIGILVVALFFYQQSANLRGQLIEETERISTIRLLLEKITSELRAAQSSASFSRPLTGDSNSIQFVKTDFPFIGDWNGDSLGRAALPVTDMKLVSYRLVSGDSTNVLGLARTEESLVEMRKLPETGGALDTNRLAEPGSLPLISIVRFVRFRYWNGADWQESWNAAQLPRGVEVTLGSEPAAMGMETNDYGSDLFRRVISIPCSAPDPTNAVSTNALSQADSPTPEAK